MWAAPTDWRYTACRPANNDPREEPSGSSFLRFHQLPAENFVGFDGFWENSPPDIDKPAADCHNKIIH